jgi:hypothetical protein
MPYILYSKRDIGSILVAKRDGIFVSNLLRGATETTVSLIEHDVDTHNGSEANVNQPQSFLGRKAGYEGRCVSLRAPVMAGKEKSK